MTTCKGCGNPIEQPPRGRRVWCSERCRKSQYGGTCKTCGTRTNGYNGRDAAADECAACATTRQHDDRYWTQQRVLEAIRAFAARYGRAPVATDWNTSTGSPAQRERFYADGCWPHYSIVPREFGSWNAAIEAAGFRGRTPGQQLYRDNRERAAA